MKKTILKSLKKVKLKIKKVTVFNVWEFRTKFIITVKMAKVKSNSAFIKNVTKVILKTEK